MADTNKEWLRDQLERARLRPVVASTVHDMVIEFNNRNIPDDAARDQIIELFGELARGHNIAPDAPEDRWVPVAIGLMVNVGDTVRVRTDAYSDPVLGPTHNGRVGRVVAKRSGDIIVKYTDNRKPQLDSVHHRPDHLERKV